MIQDRLNLNGYKYNMITCPNIVKNISYKDMRKLITKIFIQNILNRKVRRILQGMQQKGKEKMVEKNSNKGDKDGIVLASITTSKNG